MRKRTLQANAAETKGPSPGDVCLGCVHKPNPRGCHYYFVGRGEGDGVVFRTATGREGVASWVLLCDACFVKHAPRLSEDIIAGRVQIGGDMVWPEDLHIVFLPKN